jgi:GTP-binding protein
LSDAAPDFEEAGRKFFAGPCEFIWGATNIEGLPPMGPPEIAFAGRSNVGKSSLLNALTNRKTLARVSQTPGRTQQLNFFALGAEPPDEKLRLVDLPGYGHAAAAKSAIDAWTKLIHAYMRGRASLARVYVLVDARHGLKDVDTQMFDLLDKSAMSYQVVLTKRDAVKNAAEREARLADTKAALRKHSAAHPEVILTSSDTGEGIPELRGAIARLLAERGGRAD